MGHCTLINIYISIINGNVLGLARCNAAWVQFPSYICNIMLNKLIAEIGEHGYIKTKFESSINMSSQTIGQVGKKNPQGSQILFGSEKKN